MLAASRAIAVEPSPAGSNTTPRTVVSTTVSKNARRRSPCSAPTCSGVPVARPSSHTTIATASIAGHEGAHPIGVGAHRLGPGGRDGVEAPSVARRPANGVPLGDELPRELLPAEPQPTISTRATQSESTSSRARYSASDHSRSPRRRRPSFTRASIWAMSAATFASDSSSLAAR